MLDRYQKTMNCRVFIPKVSSLRTFLLAVVFSGPFASSLMAADFFKPGIGPEMFFDAREWSFTRDGNKQEFVGDVIAIGAGTLIAADRVTIDRTNNVVEAVGHVIVVSDSQIFTGSELVYQLQTADFKLVNALMIASDSTESKKVTERVLGFSKTELEFEEDRARRLKEIADRKLSLAESARDFARDGKSIDEHLVNDYALLIEQEGLTRQQENPTLSRLSAARRETLKRRREYWNKGRAEAKVLQGRLGEVAYFRLSGRLITRNDGNDFHAEEALFTPCRCKEGEDPAWAFRTSTTEAQIGGYADLYNPVLEIKGIPVLYLPYLRVPIKDKRQSGFLPPTFSFNKRSGNIYSQPVFFDFASNADATLTTDVFEKRGTRVGVEYRYQQRGNSGWTMNLEGMRDQLWMQERGQRQLYYDFYSYGAETARGTPRPAPSDPVPSLPIGPDPQEFARQRLQQRSYWETADARCLSDDPLVQKQCEAGLRSAFSVPENTWRGAYTWRGATFFAPRLSLVSNGSLISDHRYTEELYVPDDFQEAFFSGKKVTAFNRAKARVHLDGEEFYLGVGTSFGDNVLMSDRFSGEQIPANFVAQSRLVPLTPKGWRSPAAFGQIKVEDYRFLERKRDGTGYIETQEGSLGDGEWRRGEVKIVAPLVSDSVIKVDHFTDFEARGVQAVNLTPSSSVIQSWRTGFRLQLPIDGKGELPGFMQEEPKGSGPTATTTRYLHHLMNWSVTFSSRPTVVRRGAYGEATGGDPTSGLTYFVSDSPGPVNTNDLDVPEQDRMIPNQIIAFETAHRWRLFSRGWSLNAAQAKPNATPSEARESAKETARRELLYSIDRPVEGVSDMMDERGAKWYVNRYRLLDTQYAEPLTFGAGIYYDFVKVEQRRRQIEEFERDGTPGRRSTYEPWSEPYATLGINWGGWGLSNSVVYNIYSRVLKKMILTLGLPTVLQTNVRLDYSLQKDPLPDTSTIEQSKLVFKVTRTRTVNVVTTLVPSVNTYMSLARQKVEDSDQPEAYDTKIGMEYKDDSACWGLRFLRTKTYAEEERNASYLLQLQVTFMGQSRDLPGNYADPARRELPGDKPDPV